jgi:hypothetical protein
MVGARKSEREDFRRTHPFLTDSDNNILSIISGSLGAGRRVEAVAGRNS